MADLMTPEPEDFPGPAPRGDAAPEPTPPARAAVPAVPVHHGDGRDTQSPPAAPAEPPRLGASPFSAVGGRAPGATRRAGSPQDADGGARTDAASPSAPNGAEARQQWKRALAEKAKQNRRQRGRWTPRNAAARPQAGMNRRIPPTGGDAA